MVAAIGAVAAVGGSMISANAAGNAADQQSASAAEATAQRERAQAQMRQDLSPWVASGNSANNLLGYYMGTNAGGAGGGTPQLTYDDIRKQLLGQYTRSTPGGASTPAPSSPYGSEFANAFAGADPYADPSNWRNVQMTEGTGNGQSSYLNRVYTGPQTGSEIDEAGLDAAIRQRLAEQDQARAAAEAAAKNDPRYGSLLTPYRNGEEFKFDTTDLENEAGYQFGLNQGQLGIDRAQASRGNFLSGAAMKEATRFAQDYAGTKANDAFNRQSSTWQTNLGAYNGNRDRIYNFLSGVSTLGQNSAAQVGSSGVGVANANAGSTQAAGNAQSAATVAGGNALSSGLNSAANSLNSAGGWNQLLAGQSGQSGNTGTNYLQNGYDALGFRNNI